MNLRPHLAISDTWAAGAPGGGRARIKNSTISIGAAVYRSMEKRVPGVHVFFEKKSDLIGFKNVSHETHRESFCITILL